MLLAAGTDWATILSDKGLAVFIVAAIGYAGWRMVQWLAPRAESLMKIHGEHLRALDTNLSAMANTTARQMVLMEDHDILLKDIHSKMSDSAIIRRKSANIHDE